MSFNQRLGPELTPPGAEWQAAAPAARLAFFREASSRLVAMKRAELERAIGSNGRRMAARKRPRPDGATGPVLTPHREESRTSRLLAGHATPAGVTLFWRSGHSKSQRLPWGTILGFHARGEVRGAPARDVRLSKSGIAQVRVAMARWWEENHARRLRQLEADREAAARRKRPGVAARARRAIATKYPGLAHYLESKGTRLR